MSVCACRNVELARGKRKIRTQAAHKVGGIGNSGSQRRSLNTTEKMQLDLRCNSGYNSARNCHAEIEPNCFSFREEKKDFCLRLSSENKRPKDRVNVWMRKEFSSGLSVSFSLSLFLSFSLSLFLSLSLHGVRILQDKETVVVWPHAVFMSRFLPLSTKKAKCCNKQSIQYFFKPFTNMLIPQISDLYNLIFKTIPTETSLFILLFLCYMLR